MFDMRLRRGFSLAWRLHWIPLPMRGLRLCWTYCNRNRRTAIVRGPLRFILGPSRRGKLLERDWDSKPHAVSDMIAWGQNLNWPLPIFLAVFRSLSGRAVLHTRWP